MAKTPAWQRKEGKSKSGGLNTGGVARGCGAVMEGKRKSTSYA